MREYHIRLPLTADEIAVGRGDGDAHFLDADGVPEMRVADSSQRGRGCEALEGDSDAHAESGEDGVLAASWVWLSEEEEGHLAVGLHHGSHGRPLGAVCHSVYVNAVRSVVRLTEVGGNNSRADQSKVFY